MACTALRLAYPRMGCSHPSRIRCQYNLTTQPTLHQNAIFGIRVLHTSNRGILYPIRAQQSRQTVSYSIRFAILLATVGTIYNFFTKKTLKLESIDDRMLGAEYVDRRYLSPIVPLTIQQANEALRWEEGSQTVGLGSGVQRFDSVKIASNSPCEDQHVAACGWEDGEIRWLVYCSIYVDYGFLMLFFYLGPYGAFLMGMRRSSNI